MIRVFLSKFAWQIGALGAAVALLTVTGYLIAAQVENHRIASVNRQLDARISDPKTGYVVRLAQAETNTIQLKIGLERQVSDLKAKAAADAARLAETDRLLKAAQADSRAARRQAADLLSRAPAGDTLEQRVLDADARILETLK